MKKSILIVLLFMPFLWACEQDITDRKPVVRTFEQDGFRFTFSLQTEDGTNATVFKEGEKIKISYTRENLNEETAYMADFYSDPLYDDRFCRIFKADNDEVVAYPIFEITADAPACYHMSPYQIINSGFTFPNDYNVQLLEKGSYYVAFTPRFAYYSECKCNCMEENIEQFNIEISEFKINFEVK